MLAVIRLFLLAVGLICISIYACLYSLLRPFHPNNVMHAAHVLGKLSKVVGLDIEIRLPLEQQNTGPCVYICNHQNSYDILTVANAVQPMTVSVGKKSLKWIPFFGQMYWLTGNIMIDRKNTSKAQGTIEQTAAKIKEKGISVWLFPEGTRSYGRGVLPFKTGAFRTALQAEVPVVPICTSNTHKLVDLNRWNNGKVIIEFLSPVELVSSDSKSLRASTNQIRESMIEKINELSEEVGNPLV